MSFNRLNFCAFFSIGNNSLFPSNYTVNCTKWGFDLNTCPCLRCVSGYLGLSCSHVMFSIIFADLIVSKLAQINRDWCLISLNENGMYCLKRLCFINRSYFIVWIIFIYNMVFHSCIYNILYCNSTKRGNFCIQHITVGAFIFDNCFVFFSILSEWFCNKHLHTYTKCTKLKLDLL